MSTSTRRFRADVQGLRAVAVGLVVLAHVGVPGLAGGFVGVDVFFVISGFLISGQLLQELSETRGIRFGSFYARRVRRILPAALVVVVLTVAGCLLFVAPMRREGLLQDAIATVLYVPNVVFALNGTDYLAETAPSPFQHYWSLGVEEQFYLLWPLLLLGLFLLSRRRMGVLAVAIAGVVVVSLVLAVVTTPSEPSIAFFSLQTRAWEFGVGALVALAVPLLSRIPPPIAAAGGWIGLATIVVAALRFTEDTAYPGTAALVPVAGAALIVAFGGHSPHGPGMLLGLRPLQWIGLISYSLYLVHWPLLRLPQEAAGLGTPLPLWLMAGLGLLSVPVAAALYYGVEKPLRWRGHAVTGRRRTITAGIAITLAVAATATGAAAASAHPRLTSERTAEQTAGMVLPAGTPYVPANLSPLLDEAVADVGPLPAEDCQQTPSGSTLLECEFGDPDAEFTVALFGDSHAARWFPALESVAERAGIQLITLVKSRCRSIDSEDAWANSRDPSCSAWREQALAALAREKPQLIVLANHVPPRPDRDPVRAEAEWSTALASSIARLPAASEVALLAGTPDLPASPLYCLSAHLEDASACAVPREETENPPVAAAERAAALRGDLLYVDLDDYLCNETSCPVVIGSTLVYSDEDHLTATFSRTLASPLASALRSALP